MQQSIKLQAEIRPVNRFLKVHIGRMQETCVHLDYSSPWMLLNQLVYPVSARIKRKFRRTTNKNIRVGGDSLHDFLVRLKVNSEWFLSHQMFARLDNVYVRFFVKVVRQGAIDSIKFPCLKVTRGVVLRYNLKLTQNLKYTMETNFCSGRISL